MHSKTKHIPIKYHFLWEHAAEKNIRVEFVRTKEQVTDIFTNHFHMKPLSIFARDPDLFLLQNECFWMFILYVLDVHKEEP